MPRMAALITLGIIALAAARADQPTTNPTSGPATARPAPLLPDDPWSSTEIAAPEMNARPLPRGSAEARPGDSPVPRTPATNPWIRTTGSLLAVMALIGLLAWGYRVVAGNGRLNMLARGRNPGLIEVVGRTTLSPRQSLCLVRVGPRLILLGVTNDSVNALDVVQDGALVAQLMGQAAGARTDSNTAEFSRCLEREAQSYQPDASTPEESVAPEEDRILGIKAKLADTIARLRSTATTT